MKKFALLVCAMCLISLPALAQAQAVTSWQAAYQQYQGTLQQYLATGGNPRSPFYNPLKRAAQNFQQMAEAAGPADPSALQALNAERTNLLANYGISDPLLGTAGGAANPAYSSGPGGGGTGGGGGFGGGGGTGGPHFVADNGGQQSAGHGGDNPVPVHSNPNQANNPVHTGIGGGISGPAAAGGAAAVVAVVVSTTNNNNATPATATQ